jgi:hypothetical protein
MKSLRQKMLAMAAVVAVSGLMMASVAGAADKLIVKDSTGVNNVFKVDDAGTITTNGGFYYDAVNKRVGIGTATPGIDLNVVRDITGGGTVMWLDGIGEVGSGPNIAIRTARGAKGAMNPSLGGDIVGQVNFRGAAGTAGSAAFAVIRRSGFVSYATENYTTTGQGTNLSFVTTQNGTTSPTEKLIIDGSGLIYIGQAMKDGLGNIIPAPLVTGNNKLVVIGDTVGITTPRTPATSTAACYQGEISWDANYVYVCVANNTWKRTALSTW